MQPSQDDNRRERLGEDCNVNQSRDMFLRLLRLPQSFSAEQITPTLTGQLDQATLDLWAQQELRSLHRPYLLQSPSMFRPTALPMQSNSMYSVPTRWPPTASPFLGAPGSSTSVLQGAPENSGTLDRLLDPSRGIHGLSSSVENSQVQPIKNYTEKQPPGDQQSTMQADVQPQHTMAMLFDQGIDCVTRASPFLEWQSQGKTSQEISASHRKKLKTEKISESEGILYESKMSSSAHPKRFPVWRQPQQNRRKSEKEKLPIASEKEKKCRFPMPQLPQRTNPKIIQEEETKEYANTKARKITINAKSMDKFRKNWQLLQNRGTTSHLIQNVDEFTAEMFRRGLFNGRYRVNDRLYRKIHRLPSPEHHLFPIVNFDNVVARAPATQSTPRGTPHYNSKDRTALRAVAKESSVGDHRKQNDKKKARTYKKK